MNFKRVKNTRAKWSRGGGGASILPEALAPSPRPIYIARNYYFARTTLNRAAVNHIARRDSSAQSHGDNVISAVSRFAAATNNAAFPLAKGQGKRREGAGRVRRYTREMKCCGATKRREGGNGRAHTGSSASQLSTATRRALPSKQ